MESNPINPVYYIFLALVSGFIMLSAGHILTLLGTVVIVATLAITALLYWLDGPRDATTNKANVVNFRTPRRRRRNDHRKDSSTQ